MPPNPLENYKKLLAKEQQLGDTYVIIDAKWLEHWKRFVGLEQTDEENVTEPGPIDFTKLTDPTPISSSTDVQLRSDAVEGNDYTFIPYDLYKDLVNTHGKIGFEIVRKVIQQGTYQTVIETFLVPLRLRESKSRNARIKQIYHSRRTKIETLKQNLCQEFHIKPNSDYRLYSCLDEQGLDWEAIDERPDLTIEDIDLTKNAFIVYEGKPVSASSALSIYSKKSYYTPGLCGLSNLGNTCFMNSALQCLSNVPLLTKYFYQNEYREHINRDNPLGMKGDVAQAYGELIHEMWSGDASFYAPRSLKHSVARYAPQFSGFAQQDSQEFMSFLLDGLHEDLNLVKKKPYLEKIDDDGKTDDLTLANDQWEYYRKRNQSKILDIFHGQIKSVVQCLTCRTKGRIFDPICFLSLPLPSKAKMRTFKIDYVRLNGEIKSYFIKSDEHGRMHNLIQDFCSRFQPKNKKINNRQRMDTDDASNNNMDQDENSDEEEEDEEEDLTKASDYDGHQPKPDNIFPAEVYNHRIHTQYQQNYSLSSILERDQVVFYEVADSLKKENIDTILMPCTFRDNYSHQNVALPIYISVPRRNCKGKDIQDALQKLIDKFLPLSSEDSSDDSLYSASLIFKPSYNYNQVTKPLKSHLDDEVDFTRKCTELVIDLASSVVDKYRQQEQEKRIENEHSSSIHSKNQMHPQKKRPITLLDCFKYFTKNEILSDDDLWYCPQCKELKKATKKIDLWRLPKVLIVQLKRFNYTRYWRDKIDLFIDCPLRELNLSQFVLNPNEKAKAIYDLIAVSNHMGGLGGGHYTAHAKNDVDKKWHTFDDSYVSDINEDNVISKAAYVLIYQQRGSENECTKK